MVSSIARHQKIIELVYEQGKVETTELCELLKASEMTIRRDLTYLDEKGFLRRIRGGATTNLGRSYEPPFLLRTSANIENKKRIARKAAEQVYSGSSIILDGGTTVLEMIPHLKRKQDLTIVVSCLVTANSIIKHFAVGSEIRLIVSGGVVRANELSLIGPHSQYIFDNLHVDMVFLGIGGVHHREGLTEYNLDDTELKKYMLRSAKKRVVLADSSKFGVTALNLVAPISSVDSIITDKDAPIDSVQSIRNKGIEVITC